MKARDYEQHHLLSMIERLHREGASENEIVEAMKEVKGRGPRRADPPGKGPPGPLGSARLRLVGQARRRATGPAGFTRRR